MGVSVRQWTKVVTMASVRTSVMILYSVIITITWVASHGYRDNHHGVRRKVIIVKKSRDHSHVYHTRHGYQDRHHGYQGSVSVVNDHHHQPDVVVVDHGAPSYVQSPAVVAVETPTVAVAQPAVVVAAAKPAVVAAPAVVPVATASGYPRESTIDPRLIPVLRGSSPQEGDPLGIYPGGGQDPRVDPALVPEARAQLGDEVRLLQTQLEILTRRLGVRSGTRSSSRNDLDAGLLLNDDL